MRSIRLQFFSIIIAILLILLVLLNTYPLISSRDLVFQEKESGMRRMWLGSPGTSRFMN